MSPSILDLTESGNGKTLACEFVLSKIGAEILRGRFGNGYRAGERIHLMGNVFEDSVLVGDGKYVFTIGAKEDLFDVCLAKERK